jgi:hypothetical protein
LTLSLLLKAWLNCEENRIQCKSMSTLGFNIQDLTVPNSNRDGKYN